MKTAWNWNAATNPTTVAMTDSPSKLACQTAKTHLMVKNAIFTQPHPNFPGHESRSITPCMAVQASPPQQSGISMHRLKPFLFFSSRPGILFRLQRGGTTCGKKRSCSHFRKINALLTGSNQKRGTNYPFGNLCPGYGP